MTGVHRAGSPVPAVLLLGLGGILFEISSFEEQPEPSAKDIIILVVESEVMVLFER